MFRSLHVCGAGDVRTSLDSLVVSYPSIVSFFKLMLPTRVFLVRHGATILTAEDRFAGETDIPLSDQGREQVRRLADRLADLSIAGVYASPLGRTVETSRILAAPHHLEIQQREGLREISHGHWETLTRQEVEKTYPAEFALWDQDPYTFSPEDGESGLSVIARALPALLEIVRRHAGCSVIVVSHKATIRLLLSSLLGFDPRRYRDNLDQHPAALNIVDFKGPARSRLMLFNDTSHYSLGGSSLPKLSEACLSKWWTH
jgi:broad specificity phosphatase PhoE